MISISSEQSMISDKQYKANQTNAFLGGVKTLEGKEISKFNALTHGILRQSLTDYENEFYIDIYNDLVKQLKPEGIIEKVLIERIAVYYLKLFRVQKAETEYMKAKLNPRVIKSRDVIQEMTNKILENQVMNEGYTPKITDEVIIRMYETYSRYEGTLENRLYKALHELEWFQKSRATDANYQMGSFSKNTSL